MRHAAARTQSHSAALVWPKAHNMQAERINSCLTTSTRAMHNNQVAGHDLQVEICYAMLRIPSLLVLQLQALHFTNFFLGASFHVAGAREPNVSEQPVPAMPFGKAPVAVSWAPPGQT